MNQEELSKKYKEAVALSNANRETEAAPIFEALAKEGHAGAQYQLGVFYRLGAAVEQNNAIAAEWLAKAADQGLAEAQTSLAFCYQHGLGVTQNYAKALEWYSKAAEQGNANGQKEIGNCYHKGEGVDQDYVKAVEWYRKAADQGNSWAQYSLGICYYDGKGVEQDYEKAVEWYGKAAEQGHDGAQYYLGGCYLNGEGVERNVNKAVELFRGAAEQGHTGARDILDELKKMGIETAAPAEHYKTTFNYLLSHKVIPHMMFSRLEFFYELIITNPENMQIFMQNCIQTAAGMAEKYPEIEPAFPVEQFTIKLVGDTIETSVIVAEIPNCKKDCDCILIAFPCLREYARYFTCELSSNPLTNESFFIVGEWKPNGENYDHSNYGAIDFHTESFPAKVIEMIYGKR